MAYGKIKADTLVYDNSGSDVEVTLSSLGNKANLASPTFTGTVTIPTPAANDNTTKAASTAYVQTELGDYAVLAGPALTGTTTAVNLTLSGNLQVNGTTTTVASSTMTVTDKNIEIAKGAANNAAADGAGITVDSGDGDKTWNWVDATDAWTSSEHIHLGDDKKLLLGTSSDFEIVHEAGTNTRADFNTGDFYLRNRGSSGQIVFEPKLSESGLKVIGDGAVEAYHNNVKKLETTAAGVTVTGTVTDTKGELRSIPRNHRTAAYVAVASDAGKMITITTGGVTINNSVFSQGDAVSIINQSGSDQTITQGSGFNLFNTADASTGNRTLAGRGMATMYFTAADAAYISGAGLS